MTCNPSLKPVLAALVLASAAAALAQSSAAVSMPDSLIAEGIPPIPQAIVDSVGRYTEFRAASFQDWNPRHRAMLILTRFGDTAQVHMVSMPGGARRQMTFFPDSIGEASFGPSQTESFVFSKSSGGNEQDQFYRYDLATGESTLLTDGKSRNTDLLWSTDGKKILYLSSRRNGEDSDVYMVDPSDPKSDREVIQLKGGGWGNLDWSEDDSQALLMNYVSVTESHLFILDLKSGKLRPLTPEKEEVAYGGALFSKDGRSVYFTSDRDSEFSLLRKMDLATGAVKVLTSQIPWDVESFQLSRNGRQIAFLVNENGMSSMYLLDTRTDRFRKVAGIPIGQVSGLAWHNDDRDLGFTLSSATSASDAYSLDVRTGKLTRWTQSETGGLNTEAFSPPHLIKWKSFDGREITGWMYLPPAKFTGPRPVMMDIHGGPEGQFRPTFMGRYNYYLNELGIAVIEPNVRGSTGYGKSFTKLDNGILRADSYRDIETLLDWIGTQPELDAKRVMVTGGSYGGHMTFAISYLYANRIACSLPIVGISNIVSFLENTSAYRRDLRRAEYGDERDPKVREVLLRIAPINHAKEITKPIFVVQGANDPRVPLSEATGFRDAIRGLNPNVWSLIGKDEGHGFAKKKNRDFQMYATVLFMRKFLLGQ